MNLLIRDLETLADIACALNPTLRSRLRPGISPTEQQEVLRPRNIKLHPDVVALYDWHDGINRPGLRRFTPGLDFLTFREATDEYDSLLSQAESLAREFDLTTRDFGFDADFFSVMKGANGRSIMVDGNPDSSTYGLVFRVKFDDYPPVPPLGYTLPDLVRLWIRLHREGVYSVGVNGLFQVPRVAPDWVKTEFAYGIV